MDFINTFHNMNLDQICDRIFAYLDYGSLTKAKLVSSVWKYVISNGGFWKVMVERKVNKLPDWKKIYDALVQLKKNQLLGLGNAESSGHLYEYYHSMYCLVEDVIQQQLVDSNWRSGGMYHCVEYTSLENPSFGVHGCEFEIFSQWIVQMQQDCRILVRNRWTLEIEKVLEVPQTNINLNGKQLKLNRLKFNSNFITASFDLHPEICVWDSQSKELLRVLEPVAEDGNQVDGEYGDFFVKGHCLWKDMLLSCHARITRANESYIVTLRRIPVNGHEEVQLLYFQKVPPKPYFVEVAMDDDFIVLFFRNQLAFEIEIRSAVFYEELKHITLQTEQIYRFHYLDGFIVVGQIDSFSIWTAASGHCIKTVWHGGDDLNSIKMISDQYIVTYNGNGELKIWDFEGALAYPNATSSSLLIRTISRTAPLAALKRCNDKKKIQEARLRSKGIKPKMPVAYVGSCMVADEFQIVMVSHLSDGSSYLHVETFLNAA